MSVIAEFTIPTEDFGFGKALKDVEDLKLELESMIPMGESIIPYFWSVDNDHESLEESLRGYDMIEDFRMIDEIDNRRLYRVEWNEEIDGLVQGLIKNNAVILEAMGTNETWEFRLRFENTHDLSEFHTYCVEENGIRLELERLFNPAETASENPFGLTQPQLELLTTAREMGYFDVPRKATLKEVAKRLGITDSAASERMRRAQKNIILDIRHED